MYSVSVMGTPWENTAFRVSPRAGRPLITYEIGSAGSTGSEGSTGVVRRIKT